MMLGTPRRLYSSLKMSHVIKPEGKTEIEVGSRGQSSIPIDKEAPFRKTESDSHINFP